MLLPILPPRFLRHLTSALAATSMVVCASFSLAGCGQKGELYLPAKNGSEVSYAEHKNIKSQYIFGPSPSKTKAAKEAASEPTATVPANSAPVSAPEPTQSVNGGSAS
jgi:predicted small lipoprotein YifL